MYMHAAVNSRDILDQDKAKEILNEKEGNNKQVRFRFRSSLFVAFRGTADINILKEILSVIIIGMIK